MGIAFRFATAGVGDEGISGIDDVEFVITDAGWVRAGMAGGTTAGLLAELVPFFDEDGVGIIVGRRIPPAAAVGGLSELTGVGGGGGSFVGRDGEGTADDTCRGLHGGFDAESITSSSGDVISTR